MLLFMCVFLVVIVTYFKVFIIRSGFPWLLWRHQHLGLIANRKPAKVSEEERKVIRYLEHDRNDIKQVNVLTIIASLLSGLGFSYVNNCWFSQSSMIPN